MAETTGEKADRLLTEGRLIVRKVGLSSHPGLIVAECRGDSGEVYKLGYDPLAQEWRCTCSAAKGTCSHLKALKLVVVRK